MKHGKKYVEAAKLYDKQTQYDRDEAVAIVKKLATAKFDETIEAHIRTCLLYTSVLFLYHRNRWREFYQRRLPR